MLERYTVGQYYRVPVLAVADWQGYTGGVPIIGPWHEDAEIIGFAPHHYHVDWRFAPERLVALVTARRTQWKNGKACSDATKLFSRPIEARRIVAGAVPVLRRRKMRRAMPTFPRATAKQFWLPRLEQAFAGKCAKGGVCPHKGLPLDGLPVRGGMITCPGHGLRFDAKSLAVVCGP